VGSVSGVDYVAQLVTASRQLARTASRTGLGLELATCPGWTVADVLRHLHRAHAEAEHLVRGRARDSLVVAEVGDDELIVRFVEGAEQLVGALQAGSGSGPGRAAAAQHFWGRRMAHETTVHSLDVEIAADTGMLEVPPSFAADGISELIVDFSSAKFAVNDGQWPCSITLMPLDVNLAWTVSIAAGGVSGSAVSTDSADLTVAGMASDLYRWAWNRAGDDAVSLSGDQSLVDFWHANFHV
jgi:uncharacterized protein (TIGR03083 family)